MSPSGSAPTCWPRPRSTPTSPRPRSTRGARTSRAFPLFFPEKRTFFLEGDDIFAFGLGLDQDVLPYFSRRIGLVAGSEVPILAGGKVNGRVGEHERRRARGRHERSRRRGRRRGDDGRGAREAEPVARVVARRDGHGGRSARSAPAAGSSAATSRMRRRACAATRTSWSACGDWPPTGRPATTPVAYGVKVDYPNDKWDIALNYKRIGRDFAPALGFVPRPAVQLFNLGIDNRTRIARGPFQQLVHEFRPFVATDLAGRWESYRVFFAPINWRFRSGDRFEVNVNPVGERLVAPFEVSRRRRHRAWPLSLEAVPPRGGHGAEAPALHAGHVVVRRVLRRLDRPGDLDRRLESQRRSSPSSSPASGTWGGSRRATSIRRCVGNRLRLNVSPDLSVSSYVQYDTITKSVGVNTPPALDVPARGRPVRRLQPQRPLAGRPLAARLEPAGDEGAVRLSTVGSNTRPFTPRTPSHIIRALPNALRVLPPVRRRHPGRCHDDRVRARTARRHRRPRQRRAAHAGRPAAAWAAPTRRVDHDDPDALVESAAEPQPDADRFDGSTGRSPAAARHRPCRCPSPTRPARRGSRPASRPVAPPGHAVSGRAPPAR